jgi:hypothetical protein
VSITPVTLPAGAYTIAGSYLPSNLDPSEDDILVQPTLSSSLAGASFGAGTAAFVASFEEPTESDIVEIGPMAFVSSATPEPGSFVLMVGAMCGAGLFRRKARSGRR